MNCKYKNHHYIVPLQNNFFWPWLITRFLSLYLQFRAAPGISASTHISPWSWTIGQFVVAIQRNSLSPHRHEQQSEQSSLPWIYIPVPSHNGLLLVQLPWQEGCKCKSHNLILYYRKILFTSWNTRRCSGFKIKWKNSSDMFVAGLISRYTKFGWNRLRV
jgi:hypothetical protein